MNQRIINGHNPSEINRQIDELKEKYFVTITLLSTSPAPEKYSRYDTSITVVVVLTEKLECLKRD